MAKLVFPALTVLAGLSACLLSVLAVVTNIATESIPSELKALVDRPEVIWPVVGVLALLVVIITGAIQHLASRRGHRQAESRSDVRPQRVKKGYLGPATPPIQVGKLPPIARGFQARSSLFGRIGHRPNGTVRHGSITGMTLLRGQGGVGKSQLAAAYARERWIDGHGSLELLVWVNAGSRAGVLSAYADAYSRVSGLEFEDLEQAAAKFLEWLGTGRMQWLIVLDDVTSGGDLNGLWPPETAGETLVTTRRRDEAIARGTSTTIEVGGFSPGEAADYLKRLLAERPGSLTGSESLAAELGYFPLILSQAATYIADQHLTCADYRMAFARRGEPLAALLPASADLPDEYPSLVTTATALSIERADQIEPAGSAGLLLRIVAHLDPDGIPGAVLTAPPVLAYLSRIGRRPVDPDSVRRTLASFHRVSLAVFNAQDPVATLRVHALVQRVGRDRLTSPERTEAAIVAADALEAVWPMIERDQPFARALRANASTLYVVAGPELLAVPVHANWWGRLVAVILRRPVLRAHALLSHLGLSQRAAGQAGVAADYFEKLHLALESRLGRFHPDTLYARYEHASSQGESGDPAGALAKIEALLPDMVRTFGANSGDAVDTRHELARWRGESGDAVGAAAAYEQILEDWLRIQGPDSPNTLAARHELARWRGVAGDVHGALEALKAVLADEERVLGKYHPRTMIARASVAECLGLAGDPVAAVAAFTALHVDLVRHFGSDHPETVHAQEGLEFWRDAVHARPANRPAASQGEVRPETAPGAGSNDGHLEA
ncbi:Kinesin light chain 2 [Catellatospora sp. NPDC049133]|uniref:Kinesin light chain 2 n=1 Tax=Catellatospora sp. NPDC049133 TaxID=3155499 RepID=UPI0033D94390